MLTATQSELLSAALGYASLKSWRVFPAQDKRPLVKWKEGASRDPRLIREWWERRFPGAEIGFAVPEGVLVVDVDPRSDGSLPLGLPDTRTSKTMSDGTHSYFMVPAGLTFAGRAGPGVDLKAGGRGIVILPPTPGYTWLRTGAMAPLPQSFIDEWRRADWDPGDKYVDGQVKYLPWEDGTRYGLVALGNQAARILCAVNGERNNVLFAAAAGLYALVAGGELREEKVDVDLYAAALEAGLDQFETVNTLRSARSYGFKDPRRAG